MNKHFIKIILILLIFKIAKMQSNIESINKHMSVCSEVYLQNLMHNMTLMEYLDVVIFKIDFYFEEMNLNYYCLENIKILIILKSIDDILKSKSNENNDIVKDYLIPMRVNLNLDKLTVTLISEIPKEKLKYCRTYSSDYINVNECIAEIGYEINNEVSVNIKTIKINSRKIAIYKKNFFFTCIDSYTKKSTDINTINTLLLCYESYQELNTISLKSINRSKIINENSKINIKKYRNYPQWSSDKLNDSNFIIFNKCLYSDCKNHKELMFDGISKNEMYFHLSPSNSIFLKEIKIKRASIIIRKLQSQYNILYYLTKNIHNKSKEIVNDLEYMEYVSKILSSDSINDSIKTDIELITNYSDLFFYQDITNKIKLNNDNYILSLNYVPQKFDIIMNLEIKDKENNISDMILNIQDVMFFEEFKIIDISNPNLYFGVILSSIIALLGFIYIIFVIIRIFK